MKAHNPPNNPDKKNLFCGRSDEGRIFWNKQIEYQLVPIAIVINVVVLNNRLTNAGNALAGLPIRINQTESGVATVVELNGM